MLKMLVQFRKTIAWAALICGGVFTLLALLSIWGVAPQGGVMNKIMPSLAVLTVACLALLAVGKMMEK